MLTNAIFQLEQFGCSPEDRRRIDEIWASKGDVP